MAHDGNNDPRDDSILCTTKKALSLDVDYDAFDMDIIMHINSTFSVLNQLGIGPADGFDIIDDSTLWEDYLVGNTRFNLVKTYMYLSVRLLFDPPATSFAIAAMEKQKEEMAWRINVLRENGAWVYNADSDVMMQELDGGNAYGA